MNSAPSPASRTVKASSVSVNYSDSPRNNSTPSRTSVGETKEFPNFPLLPSAALTGTPSVKARRPSVHHLPVPNATTPSASQRGRHSRKSSRASVTDSPISPAVTSLVFEVDESTVQRDELSSSPHLGLASVRNLMLQQERSGTPSVTGRGISSVKGHVRRPSLLLKSNQAQQSLMESVRGEIAFAQRIQLDDHPERWADPSVAETHIKSVWDHYDVDGNGELDRAEINQIASDVVERYCILYEEQLVRDHKLATQKKNKKGAQAELSPEEVKRLMTKDVFPHLLPGTCPIQAKLAIAERITRELDVNKDGIITSTKFLFQWKRISKELLTIHTPDKTKMACIIL
jgi:hypothetical protein